MNRGNELFLQQGALIRNLKKVLRSSQGKGMGG